MKTLDLLPSALIGAVASARSMTPMATLATARLAGGRTPGRLLLLNYPLFKFGALAMGVGELFGDKMKSAPERTVFLGLLARVMSAGIAGSALAPRGRERAGGRHSRHHGCPSSVSYACRPQTAPWRVWARLKAASY